MLAGLLGRGGREMSKVIEQVYNEGCRFDGWSETFQPDKWFSACRDNGIDIEAQLRPIPFDQPLPWDHIRKGVTFEHLKKERHRTSAQLTDYKLQFQGDSSETPNNGPQMTFGRSNKRVASRQTTSAPTKNRARIKWSKGPRYRYMSHLENMAMIERALRRARLPVAYSQGFNPSMKLSFGPPLPLGFTSEAEFVDVTLESNLMPYMIEGFREALPDGIKIISAAVVFGKTRSLSASLNRVVYTVPLAGLDHSTLDDGIGHLMECNSIPVERKNKDKTKIVDVRPGIYDLKVEDDQLVMVLGLGEGRYVRATEVMSLLLDGDAKRVAGLPIHRRDMYRQEADSVIGALDL
jgi:radical SAM-linked protein